MSENTKITQEELESILNLRERIRANVESIGRLNIKKHFVEGELDQVNNDLKEAYVITEDLSLEEKRIVDEITNKYGDGDLNFQTGEYTPKAG